MSRVVSSSLKPTTVIYSDIVFILTPFHFLYRFALTRLHCVLTLFVAVSQSLRVLILCFPSETQWNPIKPLLVFEIGRDLRILVVIPFHGQGPSMLWTYMALKAGTSLPFLIWFKGKDQITNTGTCVFMHVLEPGTLRGRTCWIKGNRKKASLLPLSRVLLWEQSSLSRPGLESAYHACSILWMPSVLSPSNALNVLSLGHSLCSILQTLLVPHPSDALDSVFADSSPAWLKGSWKTLSLGFKSDPSQALGLYETNPGVYGLGLKSEHVLKDFLPRSSSSGMANLANLFICANRTQRLPHQPCWEMVIDHLFSGSEKGMPGSVGAYSGWRVTANGPGLPSHSEVTLYKWHPTDSHDSFVSMNDSQKSHFPRMSGVAFLPSHPVAQGRKLQVFPIKPQGRFFKHDSPPYPLWQHLQVMPQPSAKP